MASWARTKAAFNIYISHLAQVCNKTVTHMAGFGALLLTPFERGDVRYC